MLSSVVLAAAVVIVAGIYLQPGRHDGSRGPGAHAPGNTSEPLPGSSVPSAAAVTGGIGSGVVECDSSSASAGCPKDFTIAGSVGGLYPGKTASLRLTIENPNGEDIRVEAVTVAVSGTSNDACSAAYLRTTDYDGAPFLVVANGSANISLPVTLLRGAPDACQGVTFTLSYGGKAVRA